MRSFRKFRTLVLATQNPGKIREFKKLIGKKQFHLNLKTFTDFPNRPQVIERGNSFEANACLKARLISLYTGLPALADDSGLVIPYLKGDPGIYSARFAGEKATDSQNIAKVLRLLRKAEGQSRRAYFQCILAFHFSEKTVLFRGKCFGRILFEPSGTQGFGYDPIFYFPPLNRTFAELSQIQKNRVSHRAKAFEKFKFYLLRLLKKNN